MEVNPKRLALIHGLLAKYKRIGITGAPGTGKTALAELVKAGGALRVVNADKALPCDHDTLTRALVIAAGDGPVLVEGCAVAWALRSGLQLDAVLVLTRRHEPLEANQTGIAKGVATVMAEVAAIGATTGKGPVIIEEPMGITVQVALLGDIDEKHVAQVRNLLTPDVDEVSLEINSRGGDALAGFALYNTLKDHPARVEAKVIGLCASAATFVLMAADSIAMAENSLMMIHEASGGAQGRAGQLEAVAESLRKVNEAMVGVYAARSGQTEQTFRDMIAKGDCYLDPHQAKALGLCTSIIPDKTPRDTLAALDVNLLRGAPPQFIAAVLAAKQAEKTTYMAKSTEEKELDLNALVAEFEKFDEEKQKAFAKAVKASQKLKSLFEKKDEDEDEDEKKAKRAKAAVADRVLALTGKSGDEAVGVILAWQENAGKLTALAAEVEALKAKSEVGAFEALLTANANKLTPPMLATLRTQYAAKALSLAGITAFVETLSPIPGTVRLQGPVAAVQGEPLKHNEKTYAELSATAPSVLVALKKDDPAKWSAMREQAIAAGQISA